MKCTGLVNDRNAFDRGHVQSHAENSINSIAAGNEFNWDLRQYLKQGADRNLTLGFYDTHPLSMRRIAIIFATCILFGRRVMHVYKL